MIYIRPWCCQIDYLMYVIWCHRQVSYLQIINNLPWVPHVVSSQGPTPPLWRSDSRTKPKLHPLSISTRILSGGWARRGGQCLSLTKWNSKTNLLNSRNLLNRFAQRFRYRYQSTSKMANPVAVQGLTFFLIFMSTANACFWMLRSHLYYLKFKQLHVYRSTTINFPRFHLRVCKHHLNLWLATLVCYYVKLPTIYVHIRKIVDSSSKASSLIHCVRSIICLWSQQFCLRQPGELPRWNKIVSQQTKFLNPRVF